MILYIYFLFLFFKKADSFHEFCSCYVVVVVLETYLPMTTLVLLEHNSQHCCHVGCFNMLHHLAASHLAVGISILKYLGLVSDCSGCILFWFYSAVALLVSWEVSKGSAVCCWQHNMSFYML